ncbi:DUF1492 domain-containing protein [Fructilactobacillus hinvesii]|uniref:DUF1492 domain-containing protein n=1 Tax=Fructilactobacillus hinvesii TaxID=2940300 RepID=A0ABY5BTF5_9LACO|nr:ArpU family phage packaging/lysis transcriptional regulator [Fructilactobacillus hinvesii]USS87722.1 DUF1492 domain-containing protein [Fructilactobacillus hinvesii]
MDLAFLDYEINTSATQQQAKRFLQKKLPRLILLSGLNLVSLKSPSLSSVPTSKPVGNTNEERIVRKLEAERLVTAVVDAISSCNEPSKTILFGLYVKQLQPWQVIANLGYSKTRFYQLKKQALLDFADAFVEVDLHVYK